MLPVRGPFLYPFNRLNPHREVTPTMSFLSFVKSLSPVRTAHAHCDIPCGIYDPIAAKIAAQTVKKMVMRIEALGDSGDVSGANSLSRYITVKEEHAELCKRELAILWADYAWPNTDANEIAGKFNAALKLAGQCKQGVSMENADKLVDSVDDIATTFWATKGVEYSDPVAAARFGT